MKRSEMINKLKNYHFKVYPSVGVDKKYSIEAYFAMLVDLLENNGMLPPVYTQPYFEEYKGLQVLSQTVSKHAWEPEDV